ncbi:hypothetical protein [Tautonia sociabilis]|uniref:Uncharacterized protein n=1 Tax=Tautonia sociabilis TaxID=2080755 RepID=A0A432MCD3_9BACT|nr:hypothetical protein [Tautonia sociabilis]RUL81756.1 hypothetical protein TsocGM_24655 [Tautonia sociabilis]
MLRRRILPVAVALALLLAIAPRPSAARQAEAAPAPLAGSAPIYDPPGFYGMAWGVPSSGVPRVTSNFASPFGGVGYGYGFDPYRLLPGPFGTSLWRPGFIEPGYFDAPGAYSTFPVPRGGVIPSPGVPVGFYAPVLGPPMFDRP